ncbi:hypothetical protein FB451DRAFT_1565967 [Mycena latifolia]|nr:hypothetical protein FB451DRAFT_1565967 [Mycena latifolia]
MHFTRAFVAIAVLAVSTVQAAPGLTTSLTKRWCGFEPSCPCRFDPRIGCVLQFDDCAQQYFWPPVCGGCGSCPEICVDRLLASAFRHIPFSSAFKICTCRSCCRREDDDFDKTQFVDFRPGFTPTGQRIHSYDPQFPMQLRESNPQHPNPSTPQEPAVEVSLNPYDPPPLPRASPPPPDYAFAASRRWGRVIKFNQKYSACNFP